MRVEVKFHDRTRPFLHQWRETLGATPEEQARWYAIHLHVIRDQFLEHAGVPPEAVPDRTGGRAVYWWWFGDILLLQFVVEDIPPRPRGWWDIGRWLARRVRGVHRKVVIIRLVESPRPAGGPVPPQN